MREIQINGEGEERYRRQLSLPGFGPEGQRKLENSSVLVIGAGGVGSPCALYLAAAGVGRLGIADGDRVSLSNLHRQLLYTTADLGSPKAEAAAGTLKVMNPSVRVTPYQNFLNREQIKTLAQRYDLVIDAADGLDTKLVIADACHAAGCPHLHGGVGQFRGQVMTCLPDRGNCYRCLFGEKGGADGRQSGVLNAVCGAVGSVLAAEAIKYLLGTGELLTQQILSIDLFHNDVGPVEFCRKRAQDPGENCPPGCGPQQKGKEP